MELDHLNVTGNKGMKSTIQVVGGNIRSKDGN